MFCILKETLHGIFSSDPSTFPDDYDKDLYKAHTEELYKGLLVHLDDPSSLIQVS